MATNLSSATIFNPAMKDEPLTYYGGLSRPISDPKAYSAEAEATKAIGQVIPDVIKVAHTLTQQDLDDRIHNKIDAIRDPYQAQLASALDEAKGTKQAQEGTVTRVDVQGNPIGARGSLDILSDDTGNIPKALEDLTPNLTSLQGARANKKISKTDYDARLDALAKDFRRDFPGWRDYIDQKFQNITGENPANAVIRSRIADINSWVTQSKTEQDKILNVAMREENLRIDGMPERIAIFKQTGDATTLLKFINENQMFKRKAEIAEAQLNETKATVEDKRIQATKIGDKAVNQIVNNHIGSILESAGFSSDPTKAQAIFEGMDPETAQIVAQNIRTKVEMMKARAREELNLPIKGDPNGNSKAFYMGVDGVNKVIDENMKIPLGFADYLDGKEKGLAFHYARITQAWADKTEHTMMGTPSLGETLREVKVFEKNMGSQALAVVTPGLIATNLTNRYNKYVTGKKIAALTGAPDPITGEPATLKGDMLQARANVMADPELDEKEKPKVLAQINEHFINQIKDIQNESIPAETRRKYVERAYSEEGKGLVAQIERDGVGPGGKKGKFSTYNDLYSDEQTAAIAKLGGKHWDMYKDSAQSTWSNELLKPELRSLNQTIKDYPDFMLKWDNKAHKFGTITEANPVSSTYGREQRAVRTNAEMRVDDAVQKINSTLNKYATIAKADGMDAPAINAYVLRTLFQIVGQNPDEPTAAKFFEAIRASAKSNKPEPEKKS